MLVSKRGQPSHRPVYTAPCLPWLFAAPLPRAHENRAIDKVTLPLSFVGCILFSVILQEDER